LIPYDWTLLESGSIRKAKYVPNEHDLRGDLHIEFMTGKSYKFKDVPQHKVEKMCHHSSPGSYFHNEIRGEHASEKV
jgi:hypothetical protein